jgi:hypothetical protein
MAPHAVPQPIEKHSYARIELPTQIYKRNPTNSQLLPPLSTTDYYTPTSITGKLNLLAHN